MPPALARFPEVWAVDFEFFASDGNRPAPICCVAMELRSGRVVRRWGDEMQQPIDMCPDALVLAYFASAEMSCYLVLGWPLPAHVLDLYAEFRVLTNGREFEAGNHGRSLLAALAYFGLSHLDPDVKANWRSRILAGPPYSDQDREGILDYCQGDSVALAQLLPRLVDASQHRPHWLDHALLRGRYMRAVARMEHVGTPMDAPLHARLIAGWSQVKASVIAAVGDRYPVFDGLRFDHRAFEGWLATRGMMWPRTDTGRLSTSVDTFRQMARVYPVVAPLHEVLNHLGKLKLSDVRIGIDGRNRAMLSPFGTATGRNNPSTSGFAFGPAVWLRSLIKPTAGSGLAYIDFSSQELGIAAALSGDQALARAYLSGDPYLAFAIDAGQAPLGATKETHKQVRDLCKQLVLGTNYGMGERTLGASLGVPTAKARHLLDAHRRTYEVFWAWSQRVADNALLRGYLDTCFGWRLHVTAGTKPTSLLNHPMQSHGAEMLRLACCLATEAGIRVCAPVHDALLIEAPLQDLDDAVEATRDQMARASRIVLDGFEVRTEADLIPYPRRYSDRRGDAMWAMVMRALDQSEREHVVSAGA